MKKQKLWGWHFSSWKVAQPTSDIIIFPGNVPTNGPRGWVRVRDLLTPLG